jgi:hypothetical protein
MKKPLKIKFNISLPLPFLDLFLLYPTSKNLYKTYAPSRGRKSSGWESSSQCGRQKSVSTAVATLVARLRDHKLAKLHDKINNNNNNKKEEDVENVTLLSLQISRNCAGMSV